MKKTAFFVLITLTFFLAIAGKTNIATLAQDATDEADSVREKVKEKVELARKNPKAYIGTVTDKTESALQVKTTTGEILQVAVNEQTSFVKLDKLVEKVKFSDLAIGDFIIAMGFRDTSAVLLAKRVLLTLPTETPQRQVAMGQVTSFQKTIITIEDKLTNKSLALEPAKNSLVTLTADNKITKIKISEVKEGDTIIAVGTYEEDLLSARRIQIISQASSSLSPTPTPTPKPAE